MSKIQLTVEEGIINGKQVSFKAPCHSEDVTGLTINNIEYDLVDAIGNSLLGVKDVWASDAIVSVILNTDTDKAYVQNPTITPQNIGAVPIINANTAEYDMEEVLKSKKHCAFYYTGENTLGTPYKQGVTNFKAAMVLSYASSGGYGFQIAFISGSPTQFVRYMTNALGVSQWEELGSGFKRILTSEDDLNNIKASGSYVYYTDSIPKNCPYSNAGIVEVTLGDNSGSRVIQRVTRYGEKGKSSFRALQDNTWRDWAEFATVDKTLSMHIITTKDTNLDDYRTTGIYYFSQSYAPINIPVGVNGWLHVTSDGHTVKQIWYRYGSGDNHHNTFVRTFTGSSWQDWYQYCVLQIKTVTGTTNSNGNIPLGINSNYIILCLKVQDQIATAYYYGSEWRAHIANAGTGAAITNTEVSVSCWYAYAADWLNQ